MFAEVRAFGEVLSQRKHMGVRPSMGSVGDCYDNALCESFFATLECELIERRRFGNRMEAKMAVFRKKNSNTYLSTESGEVHSLRAPCLTYVRSKRQVCNFRWPHVCNIGRPLTARASLPFGATLRGSPAGAGKGWLRPPSIPRTPALRRSSRAGGSPPVPLAGAS